MTDSSPASFEDLVTYALESLDRVSFKLKSQQLDSIKYVVEGSDVFVWLPTGFGKSIIYESLPFVFDRLRNVSNSLVLVVSPLISLMVDQVKSLAKRGVCCAIMSDCSVVDQSFLFSEKEVDKYKVIFTSPEAVIGIERWRNLLSTPTFSERIVTVAIDEAHCVSKWYTYKCIIFSIITMV